MTEEEKKSIERMKEVRDKNVHTFVNELDTVLKIIENQKAEIEKKDKIMELIIERFKQICVTPSLAKYQWKRICSEDLKKCEGRLCEDCIKEYFEKKVEDK